MENKNRNEIAMEVSTSEMILMLARRSRDVPANHRFHVVSSLSKIQN